MKKIKIFLYIIPLLVLIALVYINVFSTHTFTSDIALESLTPAGRLVNTTLVQNLVYIDTLMHDTVTFAVAFKTNTSLLFGVQVNDSYSYKYKMLYNEALQEYFALRQINATSVPPLQQAAKQGQVVASNTLKTQFSTSYTQTLKNYTVVLRGPHTFYTSATPSVSVTKRDLNWYADDDNATITYGAGEVQVIADDGIRNATKTIGNPLLATFNGSHQTQQLTLKANDCLFTQIQAGEHFVTRKVFLANSPTYLKNMSQNTTPRTLFFQSRKPAKITAVIYHDEAAQTVLFNNASIILNKSKKKASLDLPAGSYIVSVPIENIILETNAGYFAFDNDSYFEPFEYEVIPVEQYADADAVVTDYVPSQLDQNGVWHSQVTFNRSEAYITDHKARFAINVQKFLANETHIFSVQASTVKKGLLAQ